jgi:hypothetical protein
MRTIDVPRDQWPEFLESFSLQHRGWLARIEGPRRSITELQPLAAVIPTEQSDRPAAIEISFAGEATERVRVEDPSAVRVHRTDDGADQGLEIVDRQGQRTHIGFRATATPDMLDGVAPGELEE